MTKQKKSASKKQTIDNEIPSNDVIDTQIQSESNNIPRKSLALDAIDINTQFHQITGLSATKITSHLLSNKIQVMIPNIWKQFSQLIPSHSSSSSSSSSQQSQTDFTSLITPLNELYSQLILISWDQANIQTILKSLPFLLLDFLKISLLYFYIPSSTSSSFSTSPSSQISPIYSTQLILQISKISIQLLSDLRLERHFDALTHDIPVYLLILRQSLAFSPETIIHISEMIIQVMDLIQIYSVTYTNRKKLFLTGTTTLLKPFLTIYSSLLTVNNQIHCTSAVLKSIDNVLINLFFDDIHHIEELAQIQLTSFVNQGAEEDDGKSHSGDKKRKLEEHIGDSDIPKNNKILKISSDGKSLKQPIQSYHMSFYSTITEWVHSHHPSEEKPFHSELLTAVDHVLQLYYRSSKEIANLTERNVSFVQKWRLHIKRVLHVGLGLISCICREKISESSVHITWLQFRNTIMRCVNRGLSGNIELDMNSTTNQTGAIPDHESLNVYVKKFQDIGEAYLNRTLLLSKMIVEMKQIQVNYIETITVDIIFLQTLIDLDSKIVSDATLKSILHLIANVFTWRMKWSEVDRGQEMVNESITLFLQLLDLYANLRRMDTFIRAVIEEINENRNDRAYNLVLSCSDIQDKLHHIFGTMADGQRNSCWEALLLASPKIKMKQDEETETGTGKKEGEIIHFHCFYSLSSIFAPLALSVPPYRAVPESLLVLFLSQVTLSLSTIISDYQSNKDINVLDDLSALFTLTSILMKIGFNFLSSSSFATFIPRYPYDMKYSVVYNQESRGDEEDERLSSSEDIWIIFCLFCSQLIFDIPPDYFLVAKDRLSSNTLTDHLFTTQSSHNLSLLLHSFPSEFQTKTNPQSLENFLGSIVDLIFNCSSLISVASVPLSPLNQRCLEIVPEDSFEVTEQIRFENLFHQTVSIFHDHFFFQFFNFFIDHSLFFQFPSLCLSFLRHLKVWGSAFNSFILENNLQNIQTIQIISDCLMSTTLRDQSSINSSAQSKVLELLTQPLIQSYPFLLSSVCRVSQKTLSKSGYQNFYSLLKPLHLMAKILPTDFLLSEWKIISSTCTEVLNLFIASVQNTKNVENNLVLCTQHSLQLIFRILTDVIHNKVDQQLIEITSIILDKLLETDHSFVDSFVTVSLTEFTCKEEILRNLEELIFIFINQIFRLSPSSSSPILLQKLSRYLCGSQINMSEPTEIMYQLTIYLSQILLDLSTATETNSNRLKFMISFKLFKNCCECYCEYSLKLNVKHPVNENRSNEEINSCSYDEPESLLERFVELLLSETTLFGNAELDSLYSLTGDLYLILICQRNMTKNKKTEKIREFSEISTKLEKKLANLAFPKSSAATHLGSGWLYFLTIYLKVNGARFSLLGGQYLSLSSIQPIVGNILHSIQLTIGSGSLNQIYTSNVEQLLVTLFSVVPPQLRERLVASPLINLIHSFPIHDQTINHFNFLIFDTLLQIGFCEWQDSQTNIELNQNFTKFIVENACWYCEKITTDDLSTLLEHFIAASKLYQLQLKAFHSSRTLKLKLHNGNINTTITNSEVEESRRHFDGCLSNLIYNSIVAFLSLSTSRLLSLFSHSSSSSPPQAIESVSSLIHLLLEILSSSHFSQLNSNAGTIVIIIRQLLVMVLIFLTSSPIKNKSESLLSSSSLSSSSSIELLRYTGRVLMTLSSNKHLQRHAHLFVACILEALSGFETLQSQRRQQQQRINKQLPSLMGNDIITISIHDETLREHLFPGLFALLDRCKTTKQRKQIFSILDEKSRLMFQDFNNLYQQDYKFIGKA